VARTKAQSAVKRAASSMSVLIKYVHRSIELYRRVELAEVALTTMSNRLLVHVINPRGFHAMTIGCGWYKAEQTADNSTYSECVAKSHLDPCIGCYLVSLHQ
jgi:hypothetical protein